MDLGHMVILLIFAFISGLVTILAPCIWPLLPVVLSAGATGGKNKPLGITLGILISFTVFTLSLSYLVTRFHFDPDTLRLLAVGVLVFFGLTLVIPSLGEVIEGVVSRLSGKLGSKISQREGLIGGLITGLALGIVWSPCAGPILATIATLAATQAVTVRVILVTVVYMLGTGIPLLLFSLWGSRWLGKIRTFSPYLGKIQKIFGIVMIVMALAIYTNYDKLIQAKLLDIFPAYSNLLFSLENNTKVSEQLNKLKGKGTTNRVETKSFLPDLGPAPELMGITNWLNSEPLMLSSLRGKVVLIDFWTYTCINCIRTLPFVTGWYEKYKDGGLVIIGVHTPEFEFEKKTENVGNALEMFKVNYPVAQDNNYVTWNNFNNSYWPAKYLIDKNGHIRLIHFGEGNYAETERAIQSLLAEAGQQTVTEVLSVPDQTPQTSMTPETYLGLARLAALASPEPPLSGTQKFSLPTKLANDRFAYGGEWNLSQEEAESVKDSVLEINFYASKVFLVITPDSNDDRIGVYLDGREGEEIKLDTARLYELINLPGKPGRHLLHLEFKTPGTKVFAFTFG